MTTLASYVRKSLATMLLAIVALSALAQTGAQEWVRLSPTRLTMEEPTNVALRGLWADHLTSSTSKWHASGDTRPYPARAQTAILYAPGGAVVVSALAGLYECSVSGSFDKDDLFTWCVVRVKSATSPVKTIAPACWIESEAGKVPDPATHFMRARLAPESSGTVVLLQVMQRGRPVPVCDLRVPI